MSSFLLPTLFYFFLERAPEHSAKKGEGAFFTSFLFLSFLSTQQLLRVLGSRNHPKPPAHQKRGEEKLKSLREK